MKKFEKIFFSMIAMIMMVAVGSVFTSCTNDDDEITSYVTTRDKIQDILPPEPSSEEDMSGILLSAASGNCTCVDYIRNRLGFTDTGNANQWGPILVSHGYTLQTISSSNLPQKYDIIIYHTDYGSGINSTNGHIAMVATAWLSGSNIHTEVVGANQHQSSEWSEYGCNNVSIMVHSSLKVNKVSVYRP